MLAQEADADPLVRQCLERFFVSCDAAAADSDAFFAEFAERDRARVYATADESTRLASTTSMDNMDSEAGIWERIVVSAVGRATVLSCDFDCFHEEDLDQTQLTRQINEIVVELRPDAVIRGDLFAGAPDFDPALDWWGRGEFFVEGWASSTDEVAQITQTCCGVMVKSISRIGPDE